MRNTEKSGYFAVILVSYDEIIELIDNGEAIMAIIIPPFQKDILSGKTSKLQSIFDGSDGNKALIARIFTRDYNKLRYKYYQ